MTQNADQFSRIVRFGSKFVPTLFTKDQTELEACHHITTLWNIWHLSHHGPSFLCHHVQQLG